MENLDSPEVAAWITAQNAVTDPYLAALPRRKALNERLTELWNYPRVGLPSLEGGQLFYAKNTGLQRQSPIFMRDERRRARRRSSSIRTSSPKKARVALVGVQAVARREAAGLRPLRRRRRLGRRSTSATSRTGKDLADEVRWMRFSGISWTKDAKGFFYSRYPEPPKGKVLEAALSGHTLYYHRVGTPQSAGPARLRAQGSAGLDHQSAA